MKTIKKFFRFCAGLAFQALRHHGSRSLGDGAARSLKSDIADLCVLTVSVFKIEIDGEVIAAERVIAFSLVIGAGQFAVVTRGLAVLQNHLLIKLTQVGHQAKTSRTF